VVQSISEIRTHYFDFTNDLPTGVTVTSAAAVHTPPSGTATTPTVGAIQEGRIVPVTLGVQTKTGIHYLTVTATLSDGQKSVVRLEINVVWGSVTLIDDVRKLRRMIAEPTSNIYTDEDLQAYIDSYPVMDVNGVDPTWLDYSTTPPTVTVSDDWIPTYDMNAAAAEIWDEKAADLQDKYDFAADGGRYNRSQAYEQAAKTAAKYRSKSVAKSGLMRKWPREHYTLDM
jgi:hypothetical protein